MSRSVECAGRRVSLTIFVTPVERRLITRALRRVHPRMADAVLVVLRLRRIGGARDRARDGDRTRVA